MSTTRVKTFDEKRRLFHQREPAPFRRRVSKSCALSLFMATTLLLVPLTSSASASTQRRQRRPSSSTPAETQRGTATSEAVAALLRDALTLLRAGKL